MASSKLSKKEWDEIEYRVLSGESSRSIAKDYPVTRQAIDKRFGCQATEIKTVANQLAEAEIAVKRLPMVAQVTARNLADDLMAISMHVAAGAKYGAMTFHRLAGIANQHAQNLDDNDPDPESVINIARLTKTGNEAVMPALNLLSANKSTIERIHGEADAAEKVIHHIELVPLLQ